MKSLKLYGKQDLRFETAPIPTVNKENNVLVSIKAAGICGSDISRYRDLGPYVEGMIWGHEFAGVVEAVDSSTKHVSVGDHVVVVPVLFKEEDYYIKSGQPARSDALHTMGAISQGGFAEYIAVPEDNVVIIPKNISFEAASLIEPSAVVLHGLHQVDFKIGDSAAVVGAGGTIGLLTIQWLERMGASEIIAIDIDNNRLEKTKKFGATKIINGREEDTLEQIMQYTNDLGVDHVIEAAGTPYTAATVFPYAKKGGTVLFLGIPYGDVNMSRFSFEKILRSELTIKGSWSSVTAPFPGNEWSTTVDFLGKNKIDFDSIVQYKRKLSEGPATFDEILAGNIDGKVVLIP